jgi:Spy/CpxP family protein refolding chaperone
MKTTIGAAMLLLAAIAVSPVLGGEPTSVFAQLRWSELPPDVKERALENYRAYQNLTPEERGKVESDYRRWQEMSSEDKKEFRDRYRRYQSLSKEERERLKARKR